MSNNGPKQYIMSSRYCNMPVKFPNSGIILILLMIDISRQALKSDWNFYTFHVHPHFISKVWKMAKKGLKMTFFPIKSQYFAGDCRWVSYIPKWALIYDWLLGKGLIFRTLQNSSQGEAKSWKNHKKREKLSKNFGSLRDLNPGPVGKIGNSV